MSIVGPWPPNDPRRPSETHWANRLQAHTRTICDQLGCTTPPPNLQCQTPEHPPWRQICGLVVINLGSLGSLGSPGSPLGDFLGSLALAAWQPGWAELGAGRAESSPPSLPPSPPGVLAACFFDLFRPLLHRMHTFGTKFSRVFLFFSSFLEFSWFSRVCTYDHGCDNYPEVPIYVKRATGVVGNPGAAPRKL